MAISSKRDFLYFFTQKCWGIFNYFKSTVLLAGSSQMTCTPVDHPLYFLCVHETAPELWCKKQRERSVFFLWAICISHMQKCSMYFTVCLLHTFIHNSHTHVHLSEHNIFLPFNEKTPNPTEMICNIFIFTAYFSFHYFAIKRGQNFFFPYFALPPYMWSNFK